MTDTSRRVATAIRAGRPRRELPAGDAMQAARVPLELVASLVENVPINVMYADRDMYIRYMNPAGLETLRTLEKYLPIRADEVVGSSLDIFHKSPSYQRKILSDERNLPRRAQIGLGPETLDLLVSPVLDAEGNYSGAMATWEVITDKLAMEQSQRESAEAMRSLLGRVADHAQALASAAEELTSTAAQMSANAEETSAQAQVVASASEEVAANLQSVASATEEMTASIAEIARNAADASRHAAVAVEEARETNTSISQLGSASSEVGKVVKLITTIADQTNLLALNATIEAARAGEAGKGFAVVAGEVKELARETAHATEDITERIGAIQTGAVGAVSAIERIGQTIDKANDMQNLIAAAVEEQSATTNEMTRSLSEASQGAYGITSNIAGVADAATSTAEGAAQTENAAGELSRLASELQRLVVEFSSS